MNSTDGPVAASVEERHSSRAKSGVAGHRLKTLDGMRGVAALLVVIYHFFGRWAVPEHETTLYPHGNLLDHLPFVAVFGTVGIFLFFLISGFVIMMTLENSSGIVDFVGRRIARLWPAIIVCATLSTLLINGSGVASFYDGMDHWQITPWEYVSSIFFVPPSLSAGFLGVDATGLDWVEGVYWTLWHEVRFYALIAVVFLLSPRAWFLWAWAVVQALSTAMELGSMVTGMSYFPGFSATLVFQPRVLAWFSLGLCAYVLWSGRRSPALWIIVALAVVAILAKEIVTIDAGRLAFGTDAGMELLAYAMIGVPFLLFLRGSRLLSFLALQPFVVLGLASYPLYLFHEKPGLIGMMVGVRLGLPPLFAALATMALVVCAAIAIHYLVETPAKRVIYRSWKRWTASLETRLRFLKY